MCLPWYPWVMSLPPPKPDCDYVRMLFQSMDASAWAKPGWKTDFTDDGCCKWEATGGNRVVGCAPKKAANNITVWRVNWIEMKRIERARGTIPAQLGRLPFLEQLKVSRSSRVTGTIPPELCRGAAYSDRLTDLDFQKTEISGTLPPQCGSLTKLDYIYLKRSDVSGTLPTQIGKLTALEDLKLSKAKFSGTLPAQAAAS